MVSWWITEAKVNAIHLPRKDQFQKDPQLPNETDLLKDYKHSGYDRGHLSPAIDNESNGQLVLTECFYFTNMMPQPHSLNDGDWKELETLSDNLARQHDSVYVWAGGIGELKKIGRVAVPKQCWKVLYIKKSNTYLAYLFDNTDHIQTSTVSHRVTIEDLEKLTHLDFKLY